MALFNREKTYTITQKQLDEMNRLYDTMAAENKRLTGIKEKDDLLFNYENENRELRAENLELKTNLDKAKKELNKNYSTMTAVLEKLDSTSKTAQHAVDVASLYRDMNDYHTQPQRLTSKDLKFLS